MATDQHVAITNAVAKYITQPEHATVDVLGNGHINQTLLVKSEQAVFVLQRINQAVFPEPVTMVDNALKIYQHLAKQGSQYPYANIGPRLSLSGHYIECIDGEYWRAFDYIAGCHSIETIDDQTQAHQAAYVFATFSTALADIGRDSLRVVIADFHDLDVRMSQLKQAVTNDSAGRLGQAQPLVDGFLAQHQFIKLVAKTTKELPLRVTHNDTKINNLLFDRDSGKPHAVIDLDTCMPGYLMHDFGDMVRTCCSSLAEDATNVEQMIFKADIYHALLAGYQEGGQHMMTALEKESLTLGAKLMPFIIGLRFLTDYLNGDVYFSVAHSLHNYQRALNQFTLYQLLEKQLAS